MPGKFTHKQSIYETTITFDDRLPFRGVFFETGYGTTSLDNEEHQALRDELTDLDIPMVETTVHVDGNGARMNMKGPWAGLRAGIGLGFNF